MRQKSRPETTCDGSLADVAPAGVQEARELLAGSGLSLPPIPSSLAPQFAARGRWCFASRPVRTSPYDLQRYVRQALRRLPKDYVLVAHAGHGANSYALHYYLVHRPLMLFLQVGWGGAYMDEARATADANECFGLCGEVVVAAADAMERGR